MVQTKKNTIKTKIKSSFSNFSPAIIIPDGVDLLRLAGGHEPQERPGPLDHAPHQLLLSDVYHSTTPWKNSERMRNENFSFRRKRKF